ncbi:hypothetical protein [Dipodfec virus UA04Rod_2041]|uniref:Uncharacterized protein n=1 Tax=Dipodfec virus UA04Rod_2041 TaxID=2929249 RepID=A0A976N1B9_9VIRU|nr:hypothetical protein [Dipodfec virus UA04Rod_2041]
MLDVDRSPLSPHLAHPSFLQGCDSRGTARGRVTLRVGDRSLVAYHKGKRSLTPAPSLFPGFLKLSRWGLIK